MASRTAYAGTISATDSITAANNNKLPGGWIGYAEATSDQTGIGLTETDLTGLSVTVTAGSSRRLYIEGYAAMSGTAADNAPSLRVKESTTQLQRSDFSNATANFQQGVYAPVSVTPSSGSHTYKLAAAKATGTGTIQTHASATQPAFILITDLGPTS